MAYSNINKGAGTDGLHPLILNALAPCISVIVTYLFNLTLETGDIPEVYGEVAVRLISKKGCKATPANYCPVSLTSIVYKMMEAILKS